MADSKLRGKTALITGASKGLGKSMALALAAEGAHVLLVSRNETALNEVAGEIRSAGGSAAVYAADVARESDVRHLEEQVRAQHGRIQVLINNAGVNIRKKVTEFTLDEWNYVVGTNLTSVFLMCRSFVPLMTGQGFGRIINVASTMAHVSMPDRTAYSASKAGLLGFTRALALEVAPEGITAVAVSPGPFATEMNLPLTQNPEINAQFIARLPVGRWGKLDEVGSLAVFLCSEAAGFITGTDVLIDGGWCAQ